MPRLNFKLVHKKELISKTYFLVFQTDSEMDFKPGQFFSLEVAPKTFRSYSTVSVSKNPPTYFETNLKTLESGFYISFMISTKPGGAASTYFEEIKIDQELSAIGPNGKFALNINNKPKAFVATGTGLAPFVPMIEKVLDKDKQAEIKLFFAVWNKESDFADQFFAKYLNQNYPNFKIYTVIDEATEDLDEFNLAGRVTTIVPKIVSEANTYDYYLCGHPAMVTAMNEVLEGLGGNNENIFMEKFGK